MYIFSIIFSILTASSANSVIYDTAIIDLSVINTNIANAIKTSVAMNPSLRLRYGLFSSSNKKSTVQKIKSLNFPSIKSLNFLRKQITQHQLNTLIILGNKGIYIINKKSYSGPWMYPTVKTSLSSSFISKLIQMSQAPIANKTAKGNPWWKSYIFWGGVAVITGTMILLSQLNQEPDTVEINVKY